MAATERLTLADRAWLEVLWADALVFYHQSECTLLICVSATSPALDAPAIRIYAEEKLDLTGRLTAGDRVWVRAADVGVLPCQTVVLK